MKTGLAVSEDQEKWAVCDENTLAEFAGALPHYDAEQQLIQVEARWVAKSPHQIPAEMRGRELSHTDVFSFFSFLIRVCVAVKSGLGEEWRRLRELVDRMHVKLFQRNNCAERL